jgi:Putative porin
LKINSLYKIINCVTNTVGAFVTSLLFSLSNVREILKVSLTLGLLFVISFSSTPLFAQFPTQQFPNQGSFGQQQNQGSGFDSVQQEVEIDTFNIRYFYAADPAVRIPEKDSLLDHFFQQYDPTRYRKYDFLHLGMAGTAAYSAVYQPVLRRGLDIGYHQFDVYQIRNADIKFYEQGKAFSDVFYSGAQQTDGLAKARFARNFANGVNLSVDYQRVFNSSIVTSPVFERKIFQTTGASLLDPPKGRQVALGIGVWVNRPRYDGFFTFTSNISKQFDIGGLDTATYRYNLDANRTLASVNGLLDDAQTRHQKFEVSYLSYLKLRRDSTGTKRNFLATHQISLKEATYLSYDRFTSNLSQRKDSLFYKNLITDQRGMRAYLRDRLVENSFSLSTSRARKNAQNTEGGTDSIKNEKLKIERDSTRGLDTLNFNNFGRKPISPKPVAIAEQNDWFEVGLVHEFHNINQEMGGRNINNLLLRGRWNYTPNDNIKVETYTHFNVLGYNAGDYRLSGTLFFNWKNVGSLTAKAMSQLYEPSLIQDNFVVMQKPVWDNKFAKTLENNITGTLAIPRINFEATVGYSLLNNVVYFDTTNFPKQASTPLSILQLIVNQNFKVGNFHLDNSIALQNSTEKFVRLPSVYYKNSLYWEGKLFKKAMLSRIGFDTRIVSGWSAPSYMPLTGQFQTQEWDNVPTFPALDAFASFRVQSFRVFLKYENILGNYANARFYQIYNHPTPETYFRFGVKWVLLN